MQVPSMRCYVFCMVGWHTVPVGDGHTGMTIELYPIIYFQVFTCLDHGICSMGISGHILWGIFPYIGLTYALYMVWVPSNLGSWNGHWYVTNPLFLKLDRGKPWPAREHPLKSDTPRTPSWRHFPPSIWRSLCSVRLWRARPVDQWRMVQNGEDVKCEDDDHLGLYGGMEL